MVSHSAVCSILVAAWSLSGEPLQESRAPVPPSAELRKSEREIRAQFKAEYAKKSRAKQRDLAQELLKLAKLSKENNAERYALFMESQSVASKAVVPSLAFQVIDEAAAVFAVDPFSLKKDALQAASKSAKLPAHLKEVAYFALEFSEDAAAADVFSAATSAAALAKSMARRAGDSALTRHATARAKELTSRKRSYDKIKKSVAMLATDPRHLDANLAVGSYTCFSKGDWKSGLPLLAKGSDEALRNLAEKDLSAPKEPAAQVKVGDAWWDRAKNARGAEKKNLQLRAKRWYAKAAPNVSVLIKARVLKRLKELGDLSARAGIEDLLALVDPKSDGIAGAWRREAKALIVPKHSHAQLEIPYDPPAEYDLRVVVEPMDGKAFLLIGLAAGEVQFDVVLNAPGGISSLHKLGSKNFSDNEVAHIGSTLFAQGKPTTVLCSVRRDRLMVTVDGRSIIDWKANYRRLSLVGAWKLKNKSTLFLGSVQSQFRIHRMILTPFSEEGRRLR